MSVNRIAEFDVSPRKFHDAVAPYMQKGTLVFADTFHDDGCPSFDEGKGLASCTCEIVHVVLEEVTE